MRAASWRTSTRRIFWDAIIVNDDLDKAYKSLKEILVEPPKS